jgi:hypothetical protein
VPNWCECELRITGPRVDAVLEAIAGEEEIDDLDQKTRRREATPFFFGKVIPMPPTLDIADGTQTDLALLCAENEGLGKFAIYDWVKQSGYTTPQELCEHFGWSYADMVRLGEQIKENERLYGAKNWYEWCHKNWGTKWNASDVVVERTSDGATIDFKTAWSPPLPVIRKLSEMFPGRCFTLKYWEGGAEFKGIAQFMMGEGEDVREHYKGRRGG